MNLKKYSGKKVMVVDTDDDVHIGNVDMYVQPNDNDGQEAISMDCGIWLDEEDIKSIKIIS